MLGDKDWRKRRTSSGKSVTSGATDDMLITAQNNVDSAKKELEALNLQLTAAYGLGDDGYWNRSTQQPKTQQSQQMRANTANAYGIGQFGPSDTKTPAKPAVQPMTQQSARMRANPGNAYAIGNGNGQIRTQQSTRMRQNPGHAYAIGNGNGQIRTQQSQQMRENQANAYGIGQFGPSDTKAPAKPAAQPMTEQSRKMRKYQANAYGIGQFGPSAKKPAGSAAGNAKGREIMQLQDLLVHNPDMGEREKKQTHGKNKRPDGAEGSAGLESGECRHADCRKL